MSGDWESRITVLETELRLHVQACDRKSDQMIAKQSAMDAKLDTLLTVLSMGKGARNILLWMGGLAAGGASIFAAVKWW